VRPDTGDEVGVVERSGWRRGFYSSVTIYPQHRLVHKIQEMGKGPGKKMFATSVEFIDEDLLNSDPTRETFYHVCVSQVKNPCQGKKIPGGPAVVLALETWTELVPGAEPTAGCITLQAAEDLLKAFMINSRWIHRSVPVHGDLHPGNFSFMSMPDGTTICKAFDFGYAFNGETHGDLSKFCMATRSYVSLFL
jgi:hypothetical protein